MQEYERMKRVVLDTEDPTERKLLFLALLSSSLPVLFPLRLMNEVLLEAAEEQ
jgi:hypothetical protein